MLVFKIIQDSNQRYSFEELEKNISFFDLQSKLVSLFGTVKYSIKLFWPLEPLHTILKYSNLYMYLKHLAYAKYGWLWYTKPKKYECLFLDCFKGGSQGLLALKHDNMFPTYKLLYIRVIVINTHFSWVQ